MELIPRPMSPAGTPPIRTDENLHQHWRRLMGPLGFASRHVWVTVLDREGRPLPVLPKIEDLPAIPQQRMVTNLIRAMAEGIGHPSEGITLAFLLARPGGGGPTSADRGWAACIRAEAARFGVAVRPTFLATATGVCQIHLDDVEAEAA